MDTNIVNEITDIYFGQIAISEAKKPNDENLANNYPPYDEVTRGDVIAGAIGKDQMGGKKKKKQVKEGLSNWRQDLSEVMDTIEKEENDKEIAENPNIKNKIKINPNLGEAVNGLGGTLLEMTEIGDFEGVFDELSESDIFFLTDDLIEAVVEEVFIESLKEGYNVFEIENTLLESLEVSSALLNEAKVTYGHDTDVKSDRLEKVKSAVKKVGKGILRGAGYVAGAAVRGAKAVGRELGAGYKRGRRGSGGSSESDSSSPTSTQFDSDPDSTDSGSSKPGLLSRIGSALKRGLKKVVAKGARAVSRGARSVARKMSDDQSAVSSPSPSSKVTQGKGSTSTTQSTPSSSKKSPDPWGEPTTPSKAASKPQTSSKPQAKTTTVASSSLIAKRKEAAMRAVRRNPNISKSDLDRITSSIDEAHYSLATRKVEPGKPGEAHTNAISNLVSKAITKKKTRKPVGTSRRGGSFKPSSPEEAKQLKQSWGDYWSSAAKGYREQYEIIEKAESKQQQKLFGLALSVKRGETPRSEVSAEVLKIVDSMSEKKIRDFAKTSHEGLPKKVQTKEEAIREALRDRMLEKIENQQFFDEEQIDEFFGGGPKTVLPKSTQLSGSVKPVTPGTKYPAKLGGKDVDVTYNKQGGRTVSPTTQTQTSKPGIGARAATGLAASRERLNQFNQMNSYELEGEIIDEAKRTRQERRASNTKKKGYDAQGNPNPRVSKTQVIHDVDDNLADQRHPDAAKIDVLRKTGDTWKKVQSLTPSQFAHHKLRGPGESVKEQKDDPGDKYGFDQFKDTKLFKRTTKPNKPIVRLGDSPKRPASKAVVTARGPKPGKPNTPMDDTKGFVDDLRTRIGVRGLKRKDVHFTGGMSTGSGPEKKGEVVKKIVKSDSKKIITTDDHLQNVRHMAAAASEVAPKAKVRAYQAKPATKQSGKVKPGDIVPVRVGKEGDLNDPKIGIRQNTNPSSSPKENQRRRKTARRGMKSESYDDSGFRQHSASITSSSNSSNTSSKTDSLMSRMRELGLMSSPKKKKKKKKINLS
jgi:hypothetical protein